MGGQSSGTGGSNTFEGVSGRQGNGGWPGGQYSSLGGGGGCGSGGEDQGKLGSCGDSCGLGGGTEGGLLKGVGGSDFVRVGFRGTSFGGD
jgi:hypothetical protein